MKKSTVGNAANPVIIQEKSGGGSGLVLPILAISAVGVVGYFGYQYLDKKREEKAIEKANADTLHSELDIKKHNEEINKIETGNKAFVTGTNSFGKKVTVNIVTQVKEAIDAMFIPLTDKNSVVTYSAKSKENIDQAKVKSAFFNTPVSNVNKFAKIYNIYTGKSFINDAQKLDMNLYYQIKAIFEVANKKYPVHGLGCSHSKHLTQTQQNLM